MSTLNRLTAEKIRAEIKKLSAETDRLYMETRWYPMLLAAGLFGAVAAVLKLFL
ncbi:MAG TPA: hypothetical protein VGC69_04030 [Bordetella sp.]